MDGVCEILEQDPEVSFENGGKAYHLSMLTVEDWAAATKEVGRQKPDVLRLGLSMVANVETREEKELILNRCWTECKRAHVISDADVTAWTQTLEGVAFLLWRSLLNKHPDLTLKDVHQIVRPFDQTGRYLSIDKAQALVDAVHGLPPSDPS